MGSTEYGENTGNSACTYNEAKFAQGKGKTVILIRMIPFEEQFKHLQARVMFGLNKLEVPWMLGAPMPPELPDMLMHAMGLPQWVPPAPAPAPESPATPVRSNPDWPEELAELMSIPEFVACLAELEVHKMDDVIDVIDAEEGHDKLLMAVLEALPTKPRKQKHLRNRVIVAAQSLLQLLAVFLEYDKDEDGFLSRVECMRIPAHRAVAKSGGAVGDAFDKMDLNKDGRVSFGELFEHCVVVAEEGVPPLDAEAEVQAARASAERERAAHEEMLAMQREQAALEAAQREQAAAQATQAALAQQRAQIEEQAQQLRQQQAEFERKSQTAAMEMQRKMDEASRQLEMQARQQADQLELQMSQAQAQAAGPAVRIAAKKMMLTNPRYPNLPLDGYRGQGLFHKINLEYPGLQLVHEKPYIFVVNNFISQDECRILLQKAKNLAPQTSAQAEGDKETRKSTGCVLHNEEVPRLLERMAQLVRVPQSHMQALKISRYDKGDSFGKHSDSISGGNQALGTDPEDFWNDTKRATEGCGAFCPHANAVEFITIFVYLNDVESGGRTRWRYTKDDPSFYEAPGPFNVTKIPWQHPQPDTIPGAGVDENGVHIAPEAGMAVVHFPATTPEAGAFTDRNAVHEAEEAVDTKYICQQFIVSHPVVWERGDEGSQVPARGSRPDLSLVF